MALASLRGWSLFDEKTIGVILMTTFFATRSLRACLLVSSAFVICSNSVFAQSNITLEEVTVTGTREAQPKAEVSTTISSVGEEEIQNIKPQHPTEVIGRVAGAHAAITGGEGHTMAIRQPISTSPVYLYLEDGIPTRSTGFFNHNALYEINVPQSGGVEISKGPGSSLQGSDAIGGVINVLTRDPSLEEEINMSLEYGSFGFMRGLIDYGNSWENDGLRASANMTHTDGWRDSTAYDRQATTVRWDHFIDDTSSVKTVFSASNIDQETAGSSRLNRQDYENSPTTNYTPISFRKVKALRFSSAYETETVDSLTSLTGYLRWNEMEMLPNWSLGYDPVIYKTGHSSVGLMSKYRKDFEPMRTRLVVGADLDYSPGQRDESKVTRTKVGNIYTSYTVGDQIYDYDATFMSASPYAHLETSPTDKLRVTGGLRLDAIRYEYDNHLSVVTTGNWRRHDDNTVNFLHLSPKAGLTYEFSPELNGFASYKHAFRAPSEGNLFRSGKAADSIHLDPVKVDSYEMGVRGKPTQDLSYELSVYYMSKQDDILTYNDGVNRYQTNAGETLHKGIEASIGYRLTEEWKFNLASSYAKHTYEKWMPSTTVDYSGKEMTSAPRWINNATLNYTPRLLPELNLELEWVNLGEYWMDEANTTKYEGHHLFNLRGAYKVTENFNVFGKVMNLTDRRYATAASLNGTTEEFAPGLPLSAFLGIEVKF